MRYIPKENGIILYFTKIGRISTTLQLIIAIILNSRVRNS